MRSPLTFSARLAASSALALIASSSAPAGQEPPSIRAVRVTDAEAPRIDGAFEAVWDQATPITNFRQVEPVAGAEPSEATEVRLLYDDSTLYIALLCLDSEPHEVRATLAQRDANLDPDDRVELLFDTFLDRRNAFWFQIGAGGSRGDALITRNGASFNKRWDTIWSGQVQRTDEGWQAELAIPFASINFDPDAERWGFNVRRLIRRRNEEARWATPVQRIQFFSVANAGALLGLRDLKQGLGLDLKPFAVGDYKRDRILDDDDFDVDAGLDVFYRISPAAKLSVTVNTDFAETEVDERRVNLTRFPLFFPEKRDFFLEDSGVFEFGSSGGFRRQSDVIPFFSRRIGIDGDGGEIPLLGAVKLTGKTDSYSYGVLDVQTDDEGDLDSQNLAVGRFSKNFLEQSDVGVLWTRGDPSDEGRNNTLGTDVNFRTNSFLGDRNLRASAYVLKSDTDGVSGNELAYHASISYPNDEVDLRFDYTVVEDDFDPALGFVRRQDDDEGFKKYSGEASWQPRLYSSIRQLEFTVRPMLITDTANNTEIADVLVRPIKIDFESGDELRFDYINMREVLDEDFEITDGVIIPEDAYTYQKYGVNFETSDSRPVNIEVEWWTGEFYDGDRDEYGLSVDWRTDVGVILGAEYELNDIRLPGGDFEVHVARARANFQFGPDVSWSNFAQWDNRSEFMGLNSRLWWILRPGTELFFVVNQGWQAERATFIPEESQVTVKLGYTFRL